MIEISSPSLWAKCFFSSLVFHSAALYVLIDHPFALNEQKSSLFIKTKPLSQELSLQELPIERALEEFLEEFSINPPLLQAKEVLATTEPLEPLQSKTQKQLALLLPPPLLDLPMTPLCSLPPAPFSAENLSLLPLTLTNPPLPNYFPSKKPLPEQISPSDFITKEPLIALEEDRISSDLIQDTTPSKELLFARQAAPTFSSSKDLLFEEKKQTLVTKDFMPFSSIETTELPLLPTYALSPLTELETPFPTPFLSSIEDYIPNHSLLSLHWCDGVSITPSFFSDEEGYVFSLTITPSEALTSKALKQNLYFFIDTSSNIEKHKAAVFKKSVLKALSSLQPHHLFNLYLLGKGVTKFSSHSVPCSRESLHRAEEFLNKEQDRSFFVSFNLLDKVKEAIEEIDPVDGLHTAFLLSSGKFTSNLRDRQKEITKILEKSNGKIQLFAAAVGQNNDLFNLDMISSVCGGKLLYSDTNASFPRKLCSFVKRLQTPLLKDLSISIQAEDPKASLELRCPPSHINCLYHGEPLIIMGRINRLCNLKVEMEGIGEEGLILLQKNVNFEEAGESTPALKKTWSLLETTTLYHKFLQEPTDKPLKEAKELLKTTNTRIFRE